MLIYLDMTFNSGWKFPLHIGDTSRFDRTSFMKYFLVPLHCDEDIDLKKCFCPCAISTIFLIRGWNPTVTILSDSYITMCSVEPGVVTRTSIPISCSYCYKQKSMNRNQIILQQCRLTQSCSYCYKQQCVNRNHCSYCYKQRSVNKNQIILQEGRQHKPLA